MLNENLHRLLVRDRNRQRSNPNNYDEQGNYVGSIECPLLDSGRPQTFRIFGDGDNLKDQEMQI